MIIGELHSVIMIACTNLMSEVYEMVLQYIIYVEWQVIYFYRPGLGNNNLGGAQAMMDVLRGGYSHSLVLITDLCLRDHLFCKYQRMTICDVHPSSPMIASQIL